MSLINDALKKAQRERSEGGTDITAGPAGTATASGTSRRGNSLFVLAGAALVLVFISVGATMYLVNRPAAPKPIAKGDPVSPPAQPTSSASAPVKASEIPKATAPEVRTSVVKESPSPAKAASVVDAKPAATLPAPTAPTAKADSFSRTGTASVPPSSVAATSTPATVPPTTASETRPAVSPPAAPVVDSSAPAPSSAAGSDERIHQFIDNIRVAGVRAAGNDSRVMMNDKVFRLNEIVDRPLALRLVKVETNSLTFSDANGNTYVKNF